MTTPIIHEIDVLAMQSLFAGRASEAQQKQALAWIINEACQYGGIAPDDATERQAAVFEGRRQVAFLIQKMALGSTLDKAKDFDASLKRVAAGSVPPRGRKQGQ